MKTKKQIKFKNIQILGIVVDVIKINKNKRPWNPIHEIGLKDYMPPNKK